MNPDPHTRHDNQMCNRDPVGTPAGFLRWFVSHLT